MKFNFLILLTLVGLLWPGAGRSGILADTEYEKRYTETYSVSDNARVRLDNRYGEIKVVTWAQPRVKIDVLIKVQARSQDDFEQTLKRIDIALSGSSSAVSATTTISNSSNNSWWKVITGGGWSSDDFKVYYTVNMPAGLPLDTRARYCDVQLPDLRGETILDVGYGDLVAGRLTGRSEIDVSYGSARIEEVGRSQPRQVTLQRRQRQARGRPGLRRPLQ